MGKVGGAGTSSSSTGLVDLEDIGGMVNKMKSAKQRRLEEEEAVRSGEVEPREMVTPMLRKALIKQGGCDLIKQLYVPCHYSLLGYRIVGSHSGVKLCRWTKSMLRGRGGCYKHTFYGIESHRCMETTPSLACANKCVFCWRWVWPARELQTTPPFVLSMCVAILRRHHTNPVGTEWRWKMDDPQTILKGALDNHYQMVKQFKGTVLGGIVIHECCSHSLTQCVLLNASKSVSCIIGSVTPLLVTVGRTGRTNKPIPEL